MRVSNPYHPATDEYPANRCSSMQYNLAEDCPHAKFVNYLVQERREAILLPDSQRNECPMPLCRGKVFDNFSLMVEHLQGCPGVAAGLFYCLGHGRVEEYALGHCRSYKCQWAHSPRSLRNAVKSVKKAITNPHWMSLGGKRAHKPDEVSPSLPSPTTNTLFELTNDEITPELMGQDVPLELPTSLFMDDIHMPSFPPRYEAHAMETSSPMYRSCYPPAQAERSREPGGYPVRYGMHRPPVYSQSTVSSIGSSASGLSMSQVSPQASMDSPTRRVPLSLDTTVGGSPPEWADQYSYSPIATHNADNTSSFHLPQQKKHSWGSETTFFGSSSDDIHQGMNFYESKVAPLELEGSFPSADQSVPQEMAGTDFTDAMSTAGFFPPLPGIPTNLTAVSSANRDQTTVSCENLGITATRESPFLEGLGYDSSGQLETPHRANEQSGTIFPNFQGGAFVASPDGLNRTFSFQETEDELHGGFSNFQEANGSFSPASLLDPTPGAARTPAREGMGGRHLNFLHQLKTNELPASPPRESPTGASLAVTLRPTPRTPPRGARQTKRATRKRPAPSPSPPLSPSPSPHQPSLAHPGPIPRVPCHERGYEPVGPNQNTLLSRHEKSIHAPRQDCKCRCLKADGSECGYEPVGPNRNTLLRRHKKSIHGPRQVFECQFVDANGSSCSSNYSRIDNLVRHRREAGHPASDGSSGGGDGGHGGGEKKKRKGEGPRKMVDAKEGVKAGFLTS